MSNLVDLTGKRFGRLLVIKRDEDHAQNGNRKRTFWVCKCDCGNIVSVNADSLKRGATNSCGCILKEVASRKAKIHGESKTKLYMVWRGMKTRCYNKNCEAYRDYGGRGIFICDEWVDDYASFRDWSLSNGYKPGLSIDRIDNNKGYSPSNCRFVSMLVQSNNKRNNVMLKYNDEYHSIAEWSRILGIPYKTISDKVHHTDDRDSVIEYYMNKNK